MVSAMKTTKWDECNREGGGGGQLVWRRFPAKLETQVMRKKEPALKQRGLEGKSSRGLASGKGGDSWLLKRGPCGRSKENVAGTSLESSVYAGP